MALSNSHSRAFLSVGCVAFLLAGPAWAGDEKLPERGSPEWHEVMAVDVASAKLGVSPLVRPHAAASYEVTFKGRLAGFDVGRLFFTVALNDTQYAVDYKMEQKGVARWFSDAQATSTGIGTFNEAGLVNGHYYFNHDYESEDDQKYVEILRMPDERRIRFWRDPDYDFREPLSEDLAEGAYDPMAALITLGFPPVAEGQDPCDRHAKIIEGRLRYDLRLRPDGGLKKLRAKGRNRFHGHAYRCKLSLEQIAGYREKDRRSEADGNVHVFLAEVPEGYQSKTLGFVPVRVTVQRGILSGMMEAKDPTLTKPGLPPLKLVKK